MKQAGHYIKQQIGSASSTYELLPTPSKPMLASGTTVIVIDPVRAVYRLGELPGKRDNWMGSSTKRGNTSETIW